MSFLAASVTRSLTDLARHVATQPSDQRNPLRSTPPSEISKCPWRSSPNTSASSCSTLAGRRRSVRARPTAPPPTCSLEVCCSQLSVAFTLLMSLLSTGTDVSSSIRALAAHRPDIFGAGSDEEVKRQQAEALAKSKAREMGVWDGHTATKDVITNRYQAGANFDEQIEALHRAKGLLG